MAEQFLDSLQISGFRAFRKLEIARLGQVNLIVGKNNVGKTSVLEALYLYAQQGALSAIWDIIEQRDEGERRNGIAGQVQAFSNIVYGRERFPSTSSPIWIEDSKSKNFISIEVRYRSRQGAAGAESTSNPKNLVVRKKLSGVDQIVEVVHRFGQAILSLREPLKGNPCQFVLSHGLDSERIGDLWDAITLTDREDDALKALQILAPNVERLNFLGERPRTAYVRLRGESQPVRLRSLGEGMNRVLGLILALANAADGILLIDEFENGLHYTAQPAIWQLIFEVAQRLNVQVFATTHSNDCVQAFQRVSQERPAEGLLIRLGRKNDDIVATIFDEDELAIAVEQHIEVR